MDDLDAGKTLALRILGGRDLSAKALEKRLVSKGTSEETASKTVDWLKEIGLINDAEHACSIVRHYHVKGYGLARIKAELFRREIARDVWDDALLVLDDAATEDTALHFLEKKLRGSRERNDLRRAEDALVRRGFNYEEAREAINKYLEIQDDPD